MNMAESELAVNEAFNVDKVIASRRPIYSFSCWNLLLT